MDTNIIFQILGKISAAIGSTSLTLTEKKMDSESPPQHYRQRDNWNDGDLQPKPLFIQHHLYQSQPRSEENGKNPKPLEVYSNADLSTVQSFGTLPRRYKKSSSSSANSSCVTTIQARVTMLHRRPCSQYYSLFTMVNIYQFTLPHLAETQLEKLAGYSTGDSL